MGRGRRAARDKGIQRVEAKLVGLLEWINEPIMNQIMMKGMFMRAARSNLVEATRSKFDIHVEASQHATFARISPFARVKAI